LYLFGGVSQLKGAAQTPAAEALITFAGPLTSFIIAAIASPIGAYLGPHTATGAVAGYLGTANFVLGAFNLIPAVPLDGGRLLHALLWRITKDSSTATKTAVDFSRLIAGAIIAFGILSTIAFGSLGGLWLVLIGWFILQAGSAERAAVDIVDVFAGKKAVDLAAAMPEPIPADASVSSALDRLLKSGRNAAPVMLGERLLGIVTLSDFFRNGERSGDELPVTAIMTRVEDLKSAMPSADAMDIVRMMGDNGYRQIPLIDASGHLAGFVTREGVLARISAHRHTH
jgi:CBS domain-containing protein